MSLWDGIVEFNDKYFPRFREWSPQVLSNAISGEAGEAFEAACMLLVSASRLAEKIKKFDGGGTKKTSVTKEDVMKECYDMDVYKVMLLTNIGVTEEDYSKACREKLAEIHGRMEARLKENPEWVATGHGQK